METGFSVDLGELTAVGTALADASRAIAAAADLMSSHTPDAGASRDETAAALGDLASRGHAIALQVGRRADALAASVAAYAQTDGAARRNLMAG